MNGFTIPLSNRIQLPDIDYINNLAREKGFSFGRSFKDTPYILNDLYNLFQQERLDPDAFDVNDHLFSSEYIEKEVLFRPLNSSEQAYYDYTLLFLKEIDFSSVLGVTPMDKSLNVLMYITHLSTKTNKQGNSGGSTNDPNPGPIDIKDEQALSEAIEEMSKGISDDGSSGGGKKKDNDLSTEMTKCVRDHLYDLSPAIAHIYGKNAPADVPINRNILKDIQIKGYLEDSLGLSTALETKKVRNNDSDERKRIQMETHGQISKIKKTDLVKENFDDKFINKELVVKEKVKPETRKQILYMMLDDSGSMGNTTKQTYVRATLLNRLESVVEQKSELRFCLYESKRYEFDDVKDKKDAQKLYKKISLRRPGGGGTNIGGVIQETIDEIWNMPNYHTPEIMIVCDGDDYVNPNDVKLKGVAIHAVLLGTDNPGIKKLCEESKGKYIVEKLYNRY